MFLKNYRFPNRRKNMAKSDKIMTVEDLKNHCGPDVVRKMEAAGIDWAALLANLPQLLQMILVIFGKTVAPST